MIFSKGKKKIFGEKLEEKQNLPFLNDSLDVKRWFQGENETKN